MAQCLPVRHGPRDVSFRTATVELLKRLETKNVSI